MNKQRLDDAWTNMQERLGREPASAEWSAFSERYRQAERLAPALPGMPSDPGLIRNAAPALAPDPALTANGSSRPNPARQEFDAGKPSWKQRLHRRRRWIVAAAATAAIALTVATPAGNRVLASLLNQFRMEQLTVVDKQDLETLFDSIDATGSTINQYGEFTRSAEGENATYKTIKELQEHAGGDVVVPRLFRDADPTSLHIEVSPARTMTMKVKVGAINDTMRKLGADALLPPSIDGKRITLTMGRTVELDLFANNGRIFYSQRPAPTVAVEDGVPVAEALDAVLKFPLLPAQLKQELTQSHVLDSGSAPLPVVMPEGYEQMRIAGTKVLMIRPDEAQPDAAQPDAAANGRYTAAWVKDGRLFTFGGTFAGPDAFASALKELVGT